MINAQDNSYTGRSPCHDCPRHLAGLEKNDCVRKCVRLAAYREGEPWEGKEIVKMENKDEHPVLNEKNNQQSTINNPRFV